MPTKSKAQNRLMQATAKGAKTGVKRSVAKEFVKAQHGKKVPKVEHVKKNRHGSHTTRKAKV